MGQDRSKIVRLSDLLAAIDQTYTPAPATLLQQIKKKEKPFTAAEIKTNIVAALKQGLIPCLTPYRTMTDVKPTETFVNVDTVCKELNLVSAILKTAENECADVRNVISYQYGRVVPHQGLSKSPCRPGARTEGAKAAFKYVA